MNSQELVYLSVGTSPTGNLLLEKVLTQFGVKHEIETNYWTLLWSRFMLTHFSMTKYLSTFKFQPNQRINHFLSPILSNKGLFCSFISKLKSKEDKFDLIEKINRFFPASWNLPLSPTTFEELKLYLRQSNIEYLILKSVEGARGEDISIVKREDLRFENQNKQNYILQVLISNPDTLHFRKYHIRRFVALMSLRNPFRCYLHSQGYIHCAFQAHDLEKLESLITNVNIQKLSSDYNPQECYFTLEEYYSKFKSNEEKQNLENQMQNIVRIIFDTFRDAILQDTLIASKRYFKVSATTPIDQHCFELFGLDFLVDSFLNVWLLEVNASPSLASTSKFQVDQVKFQVLNDLFLLLGFKYANATSTSFSFPDLSSNRNSNVNYNYEELNKNWISCF